MLVNWYVAGAWWLAMLTMVGVASRLRLRAAERQIDAEAGPGRGDPYGSLRVIGMWRFTRVALPASVIIYIIGVLVAAFR
jgi:hypothetical protein